MNFWSLAGRRQRQPRPIRPRDSAKMIYCSPRHLYTHRHRAATTTYAVGRRKMHFPDRTQHIIQVEQCVAYLASIDKFFQFCPSYNRIQFGVFSGSSEGAMLQYTLCILRRIRVLNFETPESRWDAERMFRHNPGWSTCECAKLNSNLWKTWFCRWNIPYFQKL